MNTKVVISLGENAVFERDSEYTDKIEKEAFRNASKMIVSLINEGYDVNIVLGCEAHINNEVCSADINSMLYDNARLAQEKYGKKFTEFLNNELEKAGIERKAEYITPILKVDSKDRAFKNLATYVGNFYSKADSKKLSRIKGYKMKEVLGKGFRRVVASPIPKGISNEEAFETDNILVAGAGIAYSEEGKPIDCLIEKDFTASLIADYLDADCLLNLTDVEYVYINFKSAKRIGVRRMTYSEAERHFIHGEFEVSTMLPKVEAAMKFVYSNGNRRSIVSSLCKAVDAMHLKTGTIIVYI